MGIKNSEKDGMIKKTEREKQDAGIEKCVF